MPQLWQTLDQILYRQGEINMESMQSPILKLRNYYPSLTKTEKKIADVVFDKGEEIIYRSITEFAEMCKVSETTIVRLCRRLGLSGYQEFKLVLARDVVVPKKELCDDIGMASNLNTLVQIVTQQNVQAINNTMRIISLDELENAIELIVNANHIEIYGVGASGYTALDVSYKFKRIGLQVAAQTDPHIQSMSASLLQKGDVVLAISFTGSTRDLVNSVEIAKEAGAKVICITNHGKSPAADLADVLLLSSVKETPLQSGALSSKIAHLHIIDLLYSGTVVKIREKATKSINITAAAVSNKLF